MEELPMPRTNDLPDQGSAESMVFDNLDVSREDLSSDIESADDDLRSEAGGVGDASSRDDDFDASRGYDSDGRRVSQQRGTQQDPYPQRVPPSQQGQQRQRDDLGRDGQQRRVSQTAQSPISELAEVRPDQFGNLIGPNGEIVARAGREARLYQRAANEGVERIKRTLAQEQYKHSKVYKDYQTLQGKMNELDSLLRTYEERDETIKNLGLNPEHQVEAMRLFKQLTSDYPGTLRKLLTQAASRGVDVAGMANQGIDAKALTEALTEKFEAMIKPIRERTEAEKARESQDAEAAARQQELEGEVNDFFMQNQEAIPYANVFLTVLEQPQYNHMTLGEIWARIQLSMARRGTNGQPDAFAANGNERNAQPRMVPNGRAHPQAGNSEMAPVNQSYESILRDVIREAGFSPNRR